MLKKSLIILLSIIPLLVIISHGCANKSEDNPYIETKDISHFDGPYDLVKVNNDGTVTIIKEGKEYIFEFLGLQNGVWLAARIKAFLGPDVSKFWIEYDQDKLSPLGNLQGYAYYESTRVHDIRTKRITSTTYRMINQGRVIAGYTDFFDDARMHKYYEQMLAAAITACKDELECKKKGELPGPGTIFVGKTAKEIQYKLAEYEKMLADYQARKKSSN